MVEIREHDTWISTATTVGSGATVEKQLDAQGSDRVTGVVNRASNFTIDLEYLDNSGNVVATETEVGGVAASGNQEFAEDAHTDSVNVKINDEAVASADASIGVKLR